MNENAAPCPEKGLGVMAPLSCGVFSMPPINFKFLNIFGFNSSFFAVVGVTGSGKSYLFNALSGKNICKVSSGGNAVTQENENFNFVLNEQYFNVIDTAGLDDKDPETNKKRIKSLKSLLSQYPRIKKILIVKPYNAHRLSESVIYSLIVFMESFPLKNFWEHTIIVNTFAEKTSRAFKLYLKNHQPFCEKIIEQPRLLEYMKKNNIDIPKKIKEYFIDSKLYLEYPEEFDFIRKDLDSILTDIEESKMMYKNIITGEEKTKLIDSKINIKGFYLERKYRITTCIDFNDKETKIEEIISEEEKAPCEPFETKKLVELVYEDDVKWYDILSLGIVRLLRDTKFFKEYKINYYKIKDKKGKEREVEGEKLYCRSFWK